MKRKELIDLKGKIIKDLIKMVGDKKLESRKLKMNVVAGKEKNLKVGKNIKRDIAQILTVIREKEIIEKLQPEKKEENKP